MKELEQFYERRLRLEAGWHVERVEQNDEARQITVEIDYDETVLRCPVCKAAAKAHDKQRKAVRHFDTCEDETWLEVFFPRVRCPEHGIQTVNPPFAAAGSRFTKGFENRVIVLCKGASVKKVAKDLGLNWNVVAGIKDRAYGRGKKKKALKPLPKPKRLHLDEISVSKGHDCFTIVSDGGTGNVLAVLDGRDAETLKSFFATQQIADFSELESISMDMAPPYIRAVRDSFPNAGRLICFDRFHVARLFNRALDAVRRQEAARLYKAGSENPLVKTRFEWLRNSGLTDNRASRRRKFMPLTKGKYQTAKAWKLKEQAARLWKYEREGNAERAWKRLLWRLSHSRIGEMKKLYVTINKHLEGILNAVRLKASNGLAEARNSSIQRVKYMACGFRNKARFKQEILFQFGGYDLTH